MRENLKIHSVTPVSGWYAVYIDTAKEGEWHKERVACWAAIEYQELSEIEADRARWAEAIEAGCYSLYPSPEVYSEVVGMVASEGGLEIAGDYTDNFLAYFHEYDIGTKEEEEIREYSVTMYQQKQREKEKVG